jgi:hypothetical protein
MESLLSGWPWPYQVPTMKDWADTGEVSAKMSNPRNVPRMDQISRPSTL